jgi:hypothetical protein
MQLSVITNVMEKKIAFEVRGGMARLVV